MSSQWAAKRKLSYGLSVFFVIAIVVGVPIFLFFHKTPTCDDGVKNQNEIGIDCGGVCSRICPSDISSPIIMWQRAFPVTSGVYNLVAYVQNPNVLNRLGSVEYSFRLYDKENAMITERRGRTFLPANETFAIFEQGVKTGTRTPARTSFEFLDSTGWIQNQADYKEPSVVAENIILSNENSAPRLDAFAHNLSLENIRSIIAVAIIYDAKDNAIGASRTIIENLSAGYKAPITFTWPAPFPSQSVRKEIMLRVSPDTAF